MNLRLLLLFVSCQFSYDGNGELISYQSKKTIRSWVWNKYNKIKIRKLNKIISENERILMNIYYMREKYTHGEDYDEIKINE